MTSNIAVAIEALQAAGIRYRLGAKWNGRAPWPPKYLDCSGLVTAVGQRLDLGIGRVHGSSNQWAYCARYGQRVTAAQAANTAGLLCFRIGVTKVNHVAITLGENKTMEARSSHTSPQVGVFGAMTARRWTGFTTIPGVTYSGSPATPPPSPVTPTPPTQPQPSPPDTEDDDMATSYIRHPNGAIAMCTESTYSILTPDELDIRVKFGALGGKPVVVHPVTVELWASLTGPLLDIKAVNTAAHR